jgi:hypothetical protein
MKKKRTAPGLTYAQELQIRRQVAISVEAERRAMVALKCACVALNDTEGLGFVRLSKFGLHLREIIDDYYKDPEVGDCQLNRRLEQMGFKIGETGGLRIGMDDDGRPIKLQAKPEV